MKYRFWCITCKGYVIIVGKILFQYPSAQNYQFFAQEKKHSSLLSSHIMLKPNTKAAVFVIFVQIAMLKTSVASRNMKKIQFFTITLPRKLTHETRLRTVGAGLHF